MENVNDEAAEIEQSPLGRGAAFTVFWRTLQVLVELLFHFIADGFHLRRAEARTDHEVRGEAADFAKIENGDGGGFFVLCGFNDEPHAFRKRVERHCL